MGKFHTKLQFACSKDELRPALGCVHFIDGYAKATDAHVAVKFSLSEFFNFTRKEVAILNGNALSAKNFQSLVGKEIEILEQGVCALGVTYPFEKEGLTFPNLETVIPQQPEAVSTIGFNVSFVKLVEAFFGKKERVSFTFSGQTAPVVVRPVNSEIDALMILMPVKL